MNELRFTVHRNLSGVLQSNRILNQYHFCYGFKTVETCLKDVSHSAFIANLLLDNSVLIAADGGQQVQSPPYPSVPTRLRSERP